MKVILKNVFDKIFSFLLLVLLSPIFILISLVNYLTVGSIFFIQERPGKNTRIFKLIKFCSMSNRKDDDGNLLDDSLRITGFGAFLRSTSLDELPELFNILKGEMSFVGPRPLLSEYLPLYNHEQIKRHLVKPGLTGLAQVKGRNTLDWEKRFELDLWYIENHSFILDLQILILTVKKVLLREGINEKDTVTMSRFKGTKEQ